MLEDTELLRRYAEDRSEPDFTELVRRNIDLVYSAALRQVNGDGHRAQDVAQIVFTDLARKAGVLWRHPALTGWLYTATYFAAGKLRRTEDRRQTREKEALAMQDILTHSEPGPDWARFRPVLDGAMQELNERERETVLLRFFDRRSFTNIAEKLGVSENAARKSVDRSLDKLSVCLARRGVTSTTGALAIALAGNAVIAAPPGLVATISGSALAGAASGGGLSLLRLMATTKLNLGILGILAVGAGILVFQHHGNTRFYNEIRNLRGQLSPRPPPRPQAKASPLGAGLRSAAGSAPRQTVPAPAEAMRRVSTWKNAGHATPAACLETYFWSIKEMDLDAFLTTWGGLDDEGKRMAQAYFATLPGETQAKYGTADRLMAKLFMWAAYSHPIAGFQVTGVEMVQPGEANVQVRLESPNGDEQPMNGNDIYQSSDGWRGGPVPGFDVEKALYGGRHLLQFENLPSPASGICPSAAMKSLKAIILGVIVAALVVGIAAQWRTRRRLVYEVGELRQQVEKNASRRTQLDQSAVTRGTRKPSQEQPADHSRDHDDKAVHREKIPSSSGLVAAEGWRNAGRRTPAAAFETLEWALNRGDTDTLAASLTFDPSTKLKLDELFARLSDEIRAKYRAPEGILAMLVAGSSQGPQAFQVLGETYQGADGATVRVRMQQPNGSVKDSDMSLRQEADGWKALIPEQQAMEKMTEFFPEATWKAMQEQR